MPDVFGPKAFAQRMNVSRETLDRLEAYAALLGEWNARHNLISKASQRTLWRRHIWDSAQLAPLIDDGAKTLADLGSGAGFPGLVLALLLEKRLRVTLYEATGKKCAFLHAAAQRMGLEVEIEHVRLEAVGKRGFDIVTARALAPLPELLDYAAGFLHSNSVCLFLKGRNLGVELTEAHKYWNMQIVRTASATDPSATILELRQVRPHVLKPEKAPNPGRRQPEGRGW